MPDLILENVPQKLYEDLRQAAVAHKRSIAEEAATTPEIVKTAPHSTKVGRLDEVGAARKPILRWDPSRQEADSSARHKTKHKHLEPTPVIPTA